MNRREALAALVAIPAVERIVKVGDLKPDDVIVVECDQVVSPEAANRMEHYMSQIWENRKIVVLGQGIRVKVMPGSQVPHA